MTRNAIRAVFAAAIAIFLAASLATDGQAQTNTRTVQANNNANQNWWPFGIQNTTPPAPIPGGRNAAPQANDGGFLGFGGGADPRFFATVVDYPTKERPGTIVIDTPRRYLYLVLDGGRAKRYGIGVGRPGFTWAGVHTVTRKAEWPDWRPPPDMIVRERVQNHRIIPAFMPGGPDNPLGARALYLGSTLYRIHGTSEPWTIGQAVSSGCIRLRNEDVIDLYNQVPVGARVVVI